MTYPTREHEELLRRALRGVADSVEPADDGLERIRARLKPPRLALAAWVMSGTEPAALRLKPVLTWFRLRIRQAADRSRQRPSASGTAALRGIGVAMARLGTGRPASSRPSWLRAAAAMAAFVVIIGSGAFAISELQQEAAPAGLTAGVSPQSSTGSSTGGSGETGQGQKILSPVPLLPILHPLRIWPMRTRQPSSPSSPQPAASPTTSCGQVSPSSPASPSSTPTPTSPSPSPTSPSPTPTDTGGGSTSPSPTPSDSSTAGASAAPSTVAYVIEASAAPAAAPAGTPAPSISPAPPVTPGTQPC